MQSKLHAPETENKQMVLLLTFNKLKAKTNFS